MTMRIEYEDTPEVVTDEATAATETTVAAPVGFPQAKAPGDELASWMLIPPGWKAPKGRQLVFVRFPAEWTDTPEKGVEIGGEPGLWRLAILSVLSIADKRIALERAGTRPERIGDDLVKQMIRCVDGMVGDWSGSRTPNSVEYWHAEIGEKCRGELQRIYMNLHQLNEVERTRFFSSCVEVRSAG